MHDRFGTRFDGEGDPLSVMGNLVDVMLVFACGLIAALLIRSGAIEELRKPRIEEVRRGRELPNLPDGAADGGSGMESVGTVFRDPASGKLILVGE